MRLLAAFAAALMAALPSAGQCSLCRLAVAQDASLGRAFNKAILILLVPALVVFGGVFVLAIRSGYPERPGPGEAE